jgi:hypothetical protein
MVTKFTQKHDEFKKCEYEEQQKWIDGIFATGDTFPNKKQKAKKGGGNALPND